MRGIARHQRDGAKTGWRLMPGALEKCPECGGATLEAVDDGETTNFYCRQCQRCWHMELDYVHRVGATTCPGCEHRASCLSKTATLGADVVQP